MARILIALSHALVDEPDVLQIKNRNAEFLRRCNMMLAEFQPLVRFSLILGILFFDRCTFLFFGFGLHRFVNLSLPDQKKYIDRWMHSRVSLFCEIIVGIRGLIMTAYFAHRDVWSYLSYDPNKHIEERVALRQRLLESVSSPVSGEEL
ncbi:MAG: hypothetical protein H7A33_08275 [Deltaproteobacteria bacterium]|nr:hypothetical protein [Deltaproteobacteria bacterium]